MLLIMLAKRLHYLGVCVCIRTDRLRRKWDTFSVYVIKGDRYMKDVESLLLRIVKPKGAIVSGRFRGAKNLRQQLMPRLQSYAAALKELKKT